MKEIYGIFGYEENYCFICDIQVAHLFIYLYIYKYKCKLLIVQVLTVT